MKRALFNFLRNALRNNVHSGEHHGCERTANQNLHTVVDLKLKSTDRCGLKMQGSARLWFWRPPVVCFFILATVARQRTRRYLAVPTCLMKLANGVGKNQSTSNQCRLIMRPSAKSCAALTLTFWLSTHRLLMRLEAFTPISAQLLSHVKMASLVRANLEFNTR